MRIALTVDPELPTPPMHYGGIERVVDMLARGLLARGHSVTLFAHPNSTCPATHVAWPGRSSRSRADALRNAVVLTSAVLARQFDIVHSFSRLAYLVPSLPLPVPKLMSYQRHISRRTTAAATRLSRGTLEFTAVSLRMLEGVSLRGRWHLVPNGVPLNRYTLRKVVAPDSPLVFLGRIEEIKGPHLAIDIAERLRRPLVLAGNVPGGQRAWFEATIAPRIDGRRVRYVGPVDDRQKNELLGAAVALLMPILWEEPFGIVMVEAMACGTPVLGLRRGAVPEVVKHGVTGFVADSVDELVAAATDLPILSRAACRDRVERFYSDEAVVSGYLAVYRELLARAGLSVSPPMSVAG